MAIFISDGAPTEGGEYSAENCKYPSVNFSNLTNNIKKLMQEQYQIIAYIQHLDFNGKYYMNCGILSDTQKQQIKALDKNGNVPTRKNDKGEFFFTYAGPSPIVTLIFIKKPLAKLTEALINSFKSELVSSNGESQALQIWPPINFNEVELKRSVKVTNHSGNQVSTSKSLSNDLITNNMLQFRCNEQHFIGVDVRLVQKKTQNEAETKNISVDYLVEPILEQSVLEPKNDTEKEEYHKLADIKDHDQTALASKLDFQPDQWLPANVLNKFFKKNQATMSCPVYFGKVYKFDNSQMPTECANPNLCKQMVSNCKCLFATPINKNKKVLLHQTTVKLKLKDPAEIANQFDDQSRKNDSLDPKKLIGWQDFIKTLSQVAQEMLDQESQNEKKHEFLLKLVIKKDKNK
jgi:hypothetical protein